MGRKPKPTALKLLDGNPGKRPIAPDEPRPIVEAPLCPEHLTAEARTEWDRIVPQLLKLGLLTQVDAVSLAAYCVLYARWCDAERKVTEGGMVVESYGQTLPNPHLSIANNTLKLLHSFASEFGLTPASRTKVRAQPTTPAKVSKWAGILTVGGTR